MTLPTSIVTGGHATDPEITDMQAAVNAILGNAHGAQSFVDAASATVSLVDVQHHGQGASASGVDIHNRADNDASPTAATGAHSALVIHQYSDLDSAVQIDDTRSQPTIVMRKTHNEVLCTGQHGTGAFIRWVGYTAAKPYPANEPVELGRLEGGSPGVPLTFASKESDTPWAFRSDSTAASLNISQSNAGVGLQISQTGAGNALNVTLSAASTGVNIAQDVNASGFYPEVITGYSHGPKFTTTINSGPVLTISQTVTGGNQVLFIDNRSAGLSIRVYNGSSDMFSVASDGTVSIQGHKIDYGTAAPAASAWLIGDRRYNSAPSVGNPKSWVCTVSGTPGTWVSEGNL